jgi:hypothetical protein
MAQSVDNHGRLGHLTAVCERGNLYGSGGMGSSSTGARMRHLADAPGCTNALSCCWCGKKNRKAGRTQGS